MNDFSQETTVDELAENFDLKPEQVADAPTPIRNAMVYIIENTGLTGDYNDGLVFGGEGGHIIQWYGRSTYLSSHDDLLQWVQDQPKLMLGVVGHRNHPETGETTTYAEVHERSRWVDDD